MLFLADESCDACMIRVLRADGHDVLAISEHQRGASDATVLKLAADTSRLLVTEDKDFGQLVFASCHGHGGVILLRYPFPLRYHIATQLSALVKDRGEALRHCFAVLAPGRIRILPG